MRNDEQHEPVHDADLRARFRALGAQVDAAAPDLAASDIHAWRATLLMQSRRTWRTGTVVGVAAGAVAMLTIGLVLGASTGYASAGEILRERGDSPLPPAPRLAVLKNIPPLMFSCATPIRAAELPPVQQGVPVIDLPPATAKTAMTLGGVLGIHELSNGNIFVNDGKYRQIRVFDSSLSFRGIVRDSAPGSSTSYGPRRVNLVKFLGDSMLMGDYQGGTMLVMAPSGQVARAMAPLDQNMLLGVSSGNAGFDDKGRLVYGAFVMRDLSLGLERANIPDSNALVRADLDGRRVDTLAMFKVTGGTKLLGRVGQGPLRYSVEPVSLMDDWALLSDGSIAIVRGGDYHVDWIHADGTRHSAPKMPFDWKPLTDEDKQRLIDSTRDYHNPRLGRAMGQSRVGPPPDGDTRPAGGRAGGGGGAVEQGPPMPVEYVPPALKSIFGFVPPLRRGAVQADLDGNAWILPATSAQSKNGELVYDVVNVKGDFHRVRLPSGRSIAGFGKGGVVYLVHGDTASGFFLEKTRIPHQRAGRRTEIDDEVAKVRAIVDGLSKKPVPPR